MREREVVANLPALLLAGDDLGGVDQRVWALITSKQEGAEQAPLDVADLAEHTAVLNRLETVLDDAFAASALPDAPQSVSALNDFVVRVQLEAR
jgi:hypothetical protein